MSDELHDVIRQLAREEKDNKPSLASLQLRELRAISRYCRVIAVAIIAQIILTAILLAPILAQIRGALP